MNAPRTNLIEKLQKILALTDSPVEGEAQAAAAMIQKMLTKHGLSMADLEKKGAAAPGIKEQGHDLGKAAFTWKLDLAEAIADHYFCYSIVRRGAKTVTFVGRPENVESLQMLYAWLINQIKRIASEERKKQAEHVDPLRWQVNFGIGAVERLSTRLKEQGDRDVDADAMALVVHHRTEISDYLEERFGYRKDGKRTKEDQAWHDKYQAQKKAKEDLKLNDPEEFYRQYPNERPEAVARREAEWARESAKNQKRYANRKGPRIDWVKEDQAYAAKSAGRQAASRINLEPFLGGGIEKVEKLG